MANGKSRVEENCEYLAQYYKSLKTISYDEVIDILKDAKDGVTANFIVQYDALNDINYSCVQIRNITKSTVEEYLTIDQDLTKVYENLLSALKKKIKIDDLILQLFPGYFGYELYCFVKENSLLNFPRKIVPEVYNNLTETYNKETHDVVCIYKTIYESIQLFAPNTLQKKEKTKSKK